MLIGQQVGPFEIVREIGGGAMGSVYLANWHRGDGRVTPVAFKVVSFGLLGNESAVARFEREAAILQQLKHPHVVRIRAAGRFKQTPFIAMEYVDGESLDRVLARRGRLPWEDVARYGKQLCDALQYAHDKGIVHRDLKPSNLMLTRDGVLKLTDFGIAKDADMTALTGTNSTIGTAAYMSPEQCRGEKELSHKSDLYSLGVAFYELLTGKKPFAAETTVELFLKHVNEKPVRPSKLVPDLPVWVDNLVMCLLEKDKDKRPLDAATVGRMLGEIEEKVRDQKSVGAEVATARRADRKPTDEALDDADRDAARTLRAGGRKRKKKAVPVYQKPWVKAVPLVAGLVAIVGLAAYLLRPEGQDAAFARVRDTADPVIRLDESAAFLAKYGKQGGLQVDQAREWFRELKAVDAERKLLKRYHSKIRGLSEGFDPEAYKVALQALDAEKAGDLSRAGQLWDEVAAKSPPLDPANYGDESAVERAVLGWVAAARATDGRDRVLAKVAELREQIEKERVFETTKSYLPSDPTGQAVRGLRLLAFGDRAKARGVWDRVVADTENEPALRLWYLLAAQQAGQTGTDPRKADDVRAERAGRVDAAVAKAEANWDRVKADPADAVGRRDVRNGCREVVALYDDEPDDRIKAAVARAKKLLDAAKLP